MMNQNGKVSVIVPIYNAEKYLGYCLNSLLSQTYTNWEAILVDDGSSDDSLEICKNYVRLDSRFQVFTKENGGVSSARNYGLQFVQGEYLEFLDSDDCLAASALEKQVQMTKEFDSQLVIMDMMMVDFERPEAGHILLSSAWLKKSPCCLNQNEFKEKEMRLIWHTALLEGPGAKLYNWAVWRSLGLKFPEDLSLGEDFVTNLRYFAACSSVVFLDECGYYYGNETIESESLTHKYREDLFEVKMYLMTQVQKNIGDVETLSEPEQDAFYCYGASSGLNCVEDMLLRSGKSHQEQIACLKQMMENRLFAMCLQEASYIPERFAVCRQKLLDGQFSQISKADIQGKEENTEEHSVGILNKLVRKCLRFVGYRLSESSRLRERLLRWESDLYQRGIKAFLRIRLQKIQTRNQKAMVRQALQSIQSLQAANQELTQYIQAMNENMTQYIQMSEQNMAQRMQISEQNMTRCLQTMAEEQTRNRERIEGDLWNMEQRLSREQYLWEINDLRQRKKAIMLATAEHQNIGDSAITLAEQQLLSSQFPDYYQVEISTYEYAKKEAYLHAIVNPQDILFLNGGGNIGDVYPEEEQFHQTIVEQFPNNRIIVFPQTISFRHLDGKTLRDSQRVYNGHRDLTMYLRGRESLEFARTYFPNVKSVLMPDVVHLLQTEYSFPRSGALMCIREDGESSLDEVQREMLCSLVEKMFQNVEHTTNIHPEDVTRDIRGLVVRQELMRFAKHQVVITDRLHGMIFAVITGTPCVVLSSFNQKIREYYEAFLKGTDGVIFLGSNLDGVKEAIRMALKVERVKSPSIQKELLVISE